MLPAREPRVPAQCRFTGPAGSLLFDESNQNLPNEESLGILLCDINPADNPEARVWYAQYSFSEDGYIKDAATEKLDADAILAVVKEATAAGNEERKKRGWGRMEVLGWAHVPHYDPATNNATWSIRGQDETGDVGINHRVRLLGRRGVLAVNMIAATEDYDDAVAQFNGSIAATAFIGGETYAEFREGDKIAQYGLTALIAGGAGAAAMKLGLFGKLWKLIAAFGKVIVVAVLAIGAKIVNVFRKRTTSVASAD